MVAVDPRSSTSVPSSDALTDGHTIPNEGTTFDGKYRIERIIGQGGMAVVLSAIHLHLDERVAIKLMLPQWAEDPELVERFMHEGRAATKIRSEHVVRVLDVGLVQGRPYLVMEYLEGRDLDQLLGSVGKLPVPTAIDYLLQACEAIAEAHVCRIIHRDLKPANLFLTHRADDSPCMKVLDFGISKRMAGGALVGRRATLPSMILGSPHYMSPEQMQSSQNVDERSDIWALGAILHELVTGAPAFQGATIPELCAAILEATPPALTTLEPDVPLPLEAAVLRCLERNPARRFANVAELAAALAPMGSEIALASASRIGRVVAGNTGPRAVSMPSIRPVTTSAASILQSGRPSKRSGPRPMSYVVGALAVLTVGSQVGWIMVSREHALHAAVPIEGPPRVDNATTLTSASTPLAKGVAATAPSVGVASSFPAPPAAPIAQAPPVALGKHASPPSPRAPTVVKAASHDTATSEITVLPRATERPARALIIDDPTMTPTPPPVLAPPGYKDNPYDEN